MCINDLCKWAELLANRGAVGGNFLESSKTDRALTGQRYMFSNLGVKPNDENDLAVFFKVVKN